MIVVGIESSHSPVLDGRDGRAVSRAKRTIATDEFLGGRRFVGIQHDQYFVTGQTRRGFLFHTFKPFKSFKTSDWTRFQQFAQRL
jgi:hemin uptake protein HemP